MSLIQSTLPLVKGPADADGFGCIEDDLRCFTLWMWLILH